MQLRSGDATFILSARLQDPLTMHVRLEGPSVTPRDVDLRKDTT
jgi:hypothetical protein